MEVIYFIVNVRSNLAIWLVVEWDVDTEMTRPATSITNDILID